MIRRCFLSINVNNIPAVAPRHLLSYLEEISPEAAAGFEFFDVAKDDIQALEKICRDLRAKPPGLFAASAFVWNIGQLRDIAKELRACSAETVIMVGGPAAETFFELYPNLVDIGAIGEGESFFAEVVNIWLIQGRDALMGTDYWSNCTDTKSRWPVDLQSRTRFVPTAYRHTWTMAYVETSRGCPFQCCFCESAATQMRYLPMQRIIEELEFFKDQGSRLIYFVDPSFLLKFDRALEILRACDRLDLRVEMEVNLDVLNDNQIRTLVGVRRLVISLGIQSWNTQVLDRATRKTNVPQLERNLAFLRDFRGNGGEVDFYPHLILGLPGDDLNSFKQSVRKTLEYKPSSVFLSHLQILPRTQFGREPHEHEIIHDHEPPFLVRSVAGFESDDLKQAHLWSDPLTAWDNTFGLDALYTLADNFEQRVSDLYERVQDNTRTGGYLIITNELRLFGSDVDEQLALALSPDTIDSVLVADFLRHCRLRFTKAHLLSGVAPSGKPSMLTSTQLLVFNSTVRVAVVNHEFSMEGPIKMVPFPERIACIAYRTRLWKIPARLIPEFHKGERARNEPFPYSSLLAGVSEPRERELINALCTDLLAHGALQIFSGETPQV